MSGKIRGDSPSSVQSWREHSVAKHAPIKCHLLQVCTDIDSLAVNIKNMQQLIRLVMHCARKMQIANVNLGPKSDRLVTLLGHNLTVTCS